MTNLKIAQLIDALEASVLNDDLTEFGIVIERLHNYSLEKERNKIIQKIDELINKYLSFDWRRTTAEIEDQPMWILNKLPTKHTIKLEAGLYLKSKNSLRNHYFLRHSNQNNLRSS
jgi:hypothetical protein